MNFLIVALLSQLALNYIIHFKKVDLPHKVKLIDGAEAAFLYVDNDNIIHRMRINQTSLEEVYPIDPGLVVKGLELKNKNAETYGNYTYLFTGFTDVMTV